MIRRIHAGVRDGHIFAAGWHHIIFNCAYYPNIVSTFFFHHGYNLHNSGLLTLIKNYRLSATINRNKLNLAGFAIYHVSAFRSGGGTHSNPKRLNTSRSFLGKKAFESLRLVLMKC
jgi:hypothetical protein